MDRYLEKFSEIIHSSCLNRYELSGRLQVESYLIWAYGYHAYIYGAGKNVDIFMQYFEEDGILFHGIIDRDKRKQGEYIRGVKIISPEEFILKNDKRAYVFVYSLVQPNSFNEKEIFHFLYKSEIVGYSIVGNSRYEISGCLSYEGIYYEDRRCYYQKEEAAIREFLNELNDIESKEILLEFIRTFMECSVYNREHLPNMWKYFYGEDKRELYCHLDDEVWVNFGANVGDTITIYLRNNLQAKKIYAVEGDKDTARELRYNLELLPSPIKEKIEIIEHFVEEDNYFKNYFDIISGEKISLINCDIEGAELEMLRQMKNIIQRDRPVLAICLYHKKEDIVEIPKYINFIVKNYKLKLRKYTPWVGNCNGCHELVLYAIPEERGNI